jgi:hypothetical protein
VRSRGVRRCPSRPIAQQDRAARLVDPPVAARRTLAGTLRLRTLSNRCPLTLRHARTPANHDPGWGVLPARGVLHDWMRPQGAHLIRGRANRHTAAEAQSARTTTPSVTFHEHFPADAPGARFCSRSTARRRIWPARSPGIRPGKVLRRGSYVERRTRPGSRQDCVSTTRSVPPSRSAIFQLPGHATCLHAPPDAHLVDRSDGRHAGGVPQSPQPRLGREGKPALGRQGEIQKSELSP